MCELVIVVLFVVDVLLALLNWRQSERIAMLQGKMAAAENLLDSKDGR